jgi:hypothetical protein
MLGLCPQVERGRPDAEGAIAQRVARNSRTKVAEYASLFRPTCSVWFLTEQGVRKAQTLIAEAQASAPV